MLAMAFLFPDKCEGIISAGVCKFPIAETHGRKSECKFQCKLMPTEVHVLSQKEGGPRSLP